MAGKFLDIKQMMRAVDTRNKNWYAQLSDDDKKLYSPYMTLKWTACRVWPPPPGPTLGCASEATQ